jgi:hypothetical protein
MPYSGNSLDFVMKFVTCGCGQVCVLMGPDMDIGALNIIF